MDIRPCKKDFWTVFYDSWYVSGALGNVWKGDSIFTKPTLSESDVEYPVGLGGG